MFSNKKLVFLVTIHVLYKTLNFAIWDRWTLFFSCFFSLNNDVSILAKWDKLTGACQSNYMSHPHVHAKRLNPRWNQQPWSHAQTWRMEQAGEMVGQISSEFSSFNDKTLSCGYISSVIDLFWGIDSFLCNLSWKLEKGRTWRNGAFFQGKPSVKLA